MAGSRFIPFLVAVIGGAAPSRSAAAAGKETGYPPNSYYMIWPTAIPIFFVVGMLFTSFILRSGARPRWKLLADWNDRSRASYVVTVGAALFFLWPLFLLAKLVECGINKLRRSTGICPPPPSNAAAAADDNPDIEAGGAGLCELPPYTPLPSLPPRAASGRNCRVPRASRAPHAPRATDPTDHPMLPPATRLTGRLRTPRARSPPPKYTRLAKPNVPPPIYTP